MIITADKKAVTKADHDRLLDASHALAAPFGIPTVVIQPQDLLQYAYYKPLLLPGLQEAIKKKLYKHPEDLDVLLRAEKHCKQSCFGETDAEIDALMLYARDYRQGFFAMAMPLVNTCEAHKKFFKEEYEEPSFNVILAQGKDARINKLLSQSFSRHARGFPEFSSDGVDRIIGLPFYVFWHECAHGAGAAEPQADKMAAMAMRKAFKASTF
ncbi:MAG: hypothetical protein H6867_09655 [Rhodospirillales bacterium]|nr:hypothetical protein [Rhodospirillales bacterium]